jgi:hypothetical protein
MELTQVNPVILVVVGVVAFKLMDLGTGYFFKKITRDDVVTKGDCENLRENCMIQKDVRDLKDTSEELCDRINEMRGIMLVMAVKSGVNPEELKDLTRVGR